MPEKCTPSTQRNVTWQTSTEYLRLTVPSGRTLNYVSFVRKIQIPEIFGSPLVHNVWQPFVLHIKNFYCSYLATQTEGSLLCSQRPMVGSYSQSNPHAQTVLQPSCYWIHNVVCTWSGCPCCMWKKFGIRRARLHNSCNITGTADNG
jgi:hypothetical protein